LAQEYHDKLKVSLWEQERLGVKPRFSWQQAAGRWIEETNQKTTHKGDIAKLRWLHSILGELMLDEITLDVIARIKEARLKEGQKSTANRYLALVRAILKRAVDEWDWLDKAPKVKLFKEAAGRVRFLTPEQVQTLLRELPAHQHDLVLFALQTGLRQANVLKLEWSEINLERGHMWVNGKQSKNREPIAVPLNREALAILHRQLGKHPARVFTYFGKPIANANTRAWKNALKRAGIEDFRWHDLRHTWASWHRMQGTPTHELQQLGGWKTSAMVERYAHLASDHLATAAARLDSIRL
jgi:integrase